MTSVFAGHTVSGAAIPCTPQSDGVRVCHGSDGGSPALDLRLKAFDGVPLEVYVILPPAPASGSDGNYPLIIQSHGYGNKANGPDDTQFYGPTADTLAKRGYAVLQLTARGFNDSCGTAASRLVDPTGCANGYIRLDDDRYEVRDPQDAAGLLADAGVIDPSRIGVTGDSYGGGVSLQLATLKDRVMQVDGSLTPWTSPGGRALQVAAAAPVIPWSDLVYSLLPNGRTFDVGVTPPTTDLSPLGIEKQSFVSGLYALGNTSGFVAPPGVNSQADLSTWYSRINAGEPYDGDPTATSIATELAQYHSAYYLLKGTYGVPAEPPPPLMIANGFTDDLFPVDEALRYRNLEHSLYPSDPVSIFNWDGGHARGQNKRADNALLSDQIGAFFDHYLKGSGAAPPNFTALTQTCPSTAPSGGPFTAASWAGLHPGQVSYASTTAQTITSAGGDPNVGQAFDPIAGGGACATASSAPENGVATYDLPPSTGSGYTLLGSALVAADIKTTGTYPEIAARLVDVDPSTNTETLVARQLYRPGADGFQLFQLHPGAWHFAAGHHARLELLGKDAPYGRASNGTFSITVNALGLLLPVHEAPNSPGTPAAVQSPVGIAALGGHHSGNGGGPASVMRCLRLASHSTILKRRTRMSATRLSVQGTAGPNHCAQPNPALHHLRQVRTVFVTIYRAAPRGRCRFVIGHPGRLDRRSGSCRRPREYRARGTRKLVFSPRSPAPPRPLPGAFRCGGLLRPPPAPQPCLRAAHRDQSTAAPRHPPRRSAGSPREPSLSDDLRALLG